MSDTAAKTKRSTRAAIGPFGQVGKIVDELDERLGVAKGGASSSTRSSPTTGPSCWGRSRSTRSSW